MVEHKKRHFAEVKVDDMEEIVSSKATVIEEHEDHQPTGVEAETPDSDDIDIDSPWDPKLIRVDPKFFSLRHVLDMIDEGDLEIAPDFQRRGVWKPWQKSRLIESILLRIPLPAFYFSQDEAGNMQVIDGRQRLSAVHDFVRGGKEGSNHFRLVSLEYLESEVGGKFFSDLEKTLWAKRINGTQISVNVVDPQTPDKVKFDIFKRINTAGSPLNAQEIRHCMSKQRSRDFLRKLATTEAFDKATDSKLKDHVRMVDREVILRFCAFMILGVSEYAEYGTMDAFLTEATRKIDSELSDKDLADLEQQFILAMDNAYGLFGNHSFRKWPENDSGRQNPINRALFEAWTVALADHPWNCLEPVKDNVVAKARKAMTEDGDFITAISVATSSHGRVEKRFETVRRILEEAGLC